MHKTKVRFVMPYNDEDATCVRDFGMIEVDGYLVDSIFVVRILSQSNCNMYADEGNKHQAYNRNKHQAYNRNGEMKNGKT